MEKIVDIISPIIVGILLVSAVFVPFIANIDHDITKVYKNEQELSNGAQNYATVEDSISGQISGEIDVSAQTFDVNGVEFDNTTLLFGFAFVTNSTLLQVDMKPTGWSGLLVQANEFGTNNPVQISSASFTANGNEIDLTYTKTDNTSSSLTILFEWIAYPDADGDSVIVYQYDGNQTYYLSEGYDIRGTYISLATSPNPIYTFEGSTLRMKDAVGTMTYTTEPIPNVSGVTSFESSRNRGDVVGTITFNDQELTIYPQLLILEKEIRVTIHGYDFVDTVINVLPIFVVIGLLISIVGVMYRRMN